MKCSHCRKCDSKNLNLSPFCNLSQKYTETYWASQADTAYINAGKNIDNPLEGQQNQMKVPPYVKKLSSPMRNTYFNEKRKAQELLTGMVNDGAVEQ